MSVCDICGGSVTIVSDVFGTWVVDVSNIIGYFCLGLEIVPKGIEIYGIGVGWRGLDEVEMTKWAELKGVSTKGDLPWGLF